MTRALVIGRIALGGLLAIEALLYALHGGMPALAWSEVAAGVLFAIPRTAPVGGVGLIAVLAFALGLHVARGEAPVPLVVYAALVALALAGGTRVRR